MIFYEIKNKKDGKVVVSNMAGFCHKDRFIENKNTKIFDIKTISRLREHNGLLIWVVASDDNDLFVSSKKFNIVVDTYCQLSTQFFNFFISKMNAHSHTITTIQGQMSTKIEGIIRRKQFRSNTYAESIKKIENIILNKNSELSEILFYLDKRLFDMKNQIDGFNLLYANTDFILREGDFSFVNLKKVILNIATPFLDQMKENGVKLCIDSITDEYSQENKIKLNYKLFNLAIYNFFDNIVKYTKENTNLKINFINEKNDISIYFNMHSRFIEDYEKDLIFEDGYSGKHSAGKSGNGIGMFYTKKALNIMGFNIMVDDVSNNYIYNGDRYSNNTFKIFIENEN